MNKHYVYFSCGGYAYKHENKNNDGTYGYCHDISSIKNNGGDNSYLHYKEK